MELSARIFVAGHRGLVGRAIVRRLQALGATNLLLRSRSELDLTDAQATRSFFEEAKPEYVFLAAARVGGIAANNRYPADFIRDNLLIQTHVIDSAHRAQVKKLLFLGSSCIYPKFAPQPIPESALLTGALEATNDAYAVAKIAGIQMCQSYHRQHGMRAISLMPTNLYGPFDNFDLENSHVLPALIRKFHEAKVRRANAVEIWGSGSPRREFLFVDDLADASIFLMNGYESPEIVNVGVGDDVTIAELAALVQKVVGFEGELTFDRSRPDGTPRKLLDVSRLSGLGWRAKTELAHGIAATYEWYRANGAAE
jgi:GDP-L-fucose synthase